MYIRLNDLNEIKIDFKNYINTRFNILKDIIYRLLVSMDYQPMLVGTHMLSSLKTNNLIVDTVISMIVMGLIGAIFKTDNFDFIKTFWKWILKYFQKKTDKNYINFKIHIENISTEHRSISNSVPIEYKAIMHKLNKHNINYKGISLLNDNQRHDYWYDSDDEEDDSNRCKQFNYLLSTDDNIKITDDIFVSHSIDGDNTLKGEKSEMQYDSHFIELYSFNLTVLQLKAQLQTWIKDYKQFVMESDIDGLVYIIAEGKTTKDDSEKVVNQVDYKSYKLQSNKNFDNIFFEQKQTLLNRINTFQNKKDLYKRLGIPNNLGLMFYGEPGCGKTSCIKAIANKLDRHILEINLAKIKTPRQLRDIFYDEILNDMYVPINKRIIILEDIDCMLDTVKQRQDSPNKLNSENTDENEKSKDDDAEPTSDQTIQNVLLKKLIDDSKPIEIKETDTTGLTLGFILNIIDGTLEQHDRIIIMSTNYPNKLDSALIRTGRIDMKINFKKCSKVICKEIIDNFYETNCNIDNIYDSNMSPSDVIELCFNHENAKSVIETMKTFQH